MWDVLLEALLDSLKVLPFLLAFFVLIELLESSKKAQQFMTKMLNGKVAPIFGGLIGVIPQCGFSVMTADLFSSKLIKTGTLIAVFVATSDEALPLLFTNQATFVDGFVVLGIKVGYAIVLGCLVNMFDRSKTTKVCDQIAMEAVASTDGCCNHEMHEKPTFWQLLKHPLVHTAKIFAYILAINIAFGAIMYYFEEQIASFMSQTLYLQPVVTALIGLIPNCGSSVLITQMYLNGIISFSAMTAGLVSNSGIALSVLFRNKENIKINLVVIAILYVAGVALGLALTPLLG